MDEALTIIAIVLSLATLWFGLHKVNLSSFASLLVATIELILTAMALVTLEWWGIAVIAFANILAASVWTIRLAVQRDDILTGAAVHAEASKDEMKALAARLARSDKVFRVLRPIGTARLLEHLAQRGRGVEEIEQMARPLALLWVVHRPDLGTLVGDFDRLLRRWRLPATEAMRVADVLAAASQRSAATFEEMVEAMLVFSEPMAGTKSAA